MNPCVIIAGGPSLTLQDVTKSEDSGLPLIGINNAYKICRRLDYLYACDVRWWNEHYDNVKNLPCRKFVYEETLDRVRRPGVEQMENVGEEGLSTEWPKIYHGKNGGYQAVNLAVLLGYNYLILLGYDMQETGGKIHWHPDHPAPLNNPSESLMKTWRANFARLAPKLKAAGIAVINATRETALDCFPQMTIEDALDVCA